MKSHGTFLEACEVLTFFQKKNCSNFLSLSLNLKTPNCWHPFIKINIWMWGKWNSIPILSKFFKIQNKYQVCMHAIYILYIEFNVGDFGHNWQRAIWSSNSEHRPQNANGNCAFIFELHDEMRRASTSVNKCFLLNLLIFSIVFDVSNFILWKHCMCLLCSSVLFYSTQLTVVQISYRNIHFIGNYSNRTTRTKNNNNNS